ncbi:restriction system protein [Streptosporangium subroseum]|uniref:Restriction system protein n=1 Tax=Streptosporangium subroseum TaxID=106412 RepID=A0A239PAR7_9ACTN|nr:hypothetical protein [Streptosporangium subroseum]SNT64236.1 restriction system protein [Streptosporangium subroseum]
MPIIVGERKRKPTIAGLLSDVVADQQRAKQQTTKLERQAAAAWAKENAKNVARNQREQAARDRQEARDRELAAGTAEAEAVTRALQARITELETLLTSTLNEDPYISFETLKEPWQIPEFRPPAGLTTPAQPPDERDYAPEPLSGLTMLLPGRKRAHALAERENRERYHRDVTAHAESERERQATLEDERLRHEERCRQERARIERQHEVVDRWAADYAEGKRKAVADYFVQILGSGRYRRTSRPM